MTLTRGTTLHRALAPITALIIAVVVTVSGAFTAPAQATDSPDLAQSVAENETIGTGTVVIDHGHVDVGPRIVDGQWVVMARDDSVAPPVWHHLNDVVIRVVDAAKLDTPQDDAYGFLSASPSWYVIPQTEMPGVVWLGWNTQDPQVTQRVQRGVTMSLGPVSGPGESYLFLQDGTFGEPRILMNGQDGDAHDVWVDVNTHVHANWAFSAPGVYTAPLTFTAESSDGATLTHSSVLRFAVGSDTDPAAAFQAEAPATPNASTGTPDSPHSGAENPAGENSAEPAQDAQAASSDEGLPVWLIGVFIVAALLPVMSLVAIKARKSKQEALQAMDEARRAREAKASDNAQATSGQQDTSSEGHTR